MAEQKIPKAHVSYDDYKNLVTVVEKHRADRLVDLDTFLKISQEKNVIILDTRSEHRYERIHIKGARHLAFTEFTQENLAKLIPDLNTKILIYCNNNFDTKITDLASKMVRPPTDPQQRKAIMLALNIPTYINLYGYGYKNVYELYELVNPDDKRIQFEGSTVKK